MARGNVKDIKGEKFGRLTVTKFVSIGSRGAIWEAMCECGSVIQVIGTRLRSGVVKSCGCLRREMAAARSASPNKPSRETFYNLYIEKNLSQKQLADIFDVTDKTIYHWGKSFGIVKEPGRGQELNLPDLTSEKTQVVIGSLLGDAWISSKSGKPDSNHILAKEQCVAHRPYLEWHDKIFGVHSNSVAERWRESQTMLRGKWVSAGLKQSFVFTTRTSKIFNPFKEEWYKESKKVVPDNIKLTPLTLAVWYADDGENYQGELVKFHTEDFSTEEVEWLIAQLKSEYGFDFYWLYKDRRRKKYPVMFSRRNSTDEFLDLIEPFLESWSCFPQKLIRSSRPKRRTIDRGQVAEMHKAGMNGVEIAKELGFTPSPIHKIIRKLRLLTEPA